MSVFSGAWRVPVYKYTYTLNTLSSCFSAKLDRRDFPLKNHVWFHSFGGIEKIIKSQNGNYQIETQTPHFFVYEIRERLQSILLPCATWWLVCTAATAGRSSLFPQPLLFCSVAALQLRQLPTSKLGNICTHPLN